jgi:hypothetical protein
MGPALATLNINSSSKATYSVTLTVPGGINDLVIANPVDLPGYFNLYSVQITRIQ